MQQNSVNFGPKCSPAIQNVPQAPLAVLAGFSTLLSTRMFNTTDAFYLCTVSHGICKLLISNLEITVSSAPLLVAQVSMWTRVWILEMKIPRLGGTGITVYHVVLGICLFSLRLGRNHEKLTFDRKKTSYKSLGAWPKCLRMSIPHII